jgi:hypothetical protein
MVSSVMWKQTVKTSQMLRTVRKSQYISAEKSSSNNFKKNENCLSIYIHIYIYIVAITLLATTESIMK